VAQPPSKRSLPPSQSPSPQGDKRAASGTHGGKAAANAPPTRLKDIAGYELIAKIGQGGMATVFKARQKSLDRVVALKILPPSIAKDAEFLERFVREARASAKLNHLNIVQGIDVGQDEATGLWYFAMELVDGPSLKEVLVHQGVMPEDDALEVVAQVGAALEYIAARGMVHRDVKPDNILLTSNGEAKLADLGLAKHLKDDAALTQSGNTVGTPHYMAPEQVRGQLDQFDIRTDIYALGATLFHLVTGHPPFQGETGAVIMSKHLTEPPPSARRANPAVSEGCARLIERMMQKKKEDRVQTPAELLRLVAKVRKGEVTGLRAPVRGATGAHASVKRSKREPAAAARRAPLGPKLALGAMALVAIGLAVAAVGVPKGIREALGLGSAQQEAEQDTSLAKLELGNKAGTPGAAATTGQAEATPATGQRKKSGTGEATELATKTRPDATGGGGENEDPDFIGPLPRDDFGPPEPAEDARGQNIRAADGREFGGFHGEYYVGQAFETLKEDQQDQTVDFKWSGGVPAGYTPSLGFSARWSGFVDPPQSGDYAFDIVSYAGSRLYVDNYLIYDSWGGKGNIGRTLPLPLEKGKKYAVRFEVRCRGDREHSAVASLKWSLPGEPSVLVNADPPDTAEVGLPVGHLHGGWKAEYGKSGTEEPLVTRKELVIAWDWGSGPPAPEVPTDRFWSRWTGLVQAPETDDYVFHLAFDEGARLFLNDVPLLDYYNLGAGKGDSAPVRLEKGKTYLVRVDHYEHNEYANCYLRWSCSTFKDVLVRSVGMGEPSGVLSQDGYLAEYGHGESSKVLLSRHELLVNWNWKGGSPAPEINPDRFWANYTGWITPPADGEYTFTLDYDEGVRFYLDDVMLYDAGGRGGEGNVDVGPITLKGGKHYYVRLEYWENNEYARMRFLWRCAGAAGASPAKDKPPAGKQTDVAPPAGPAEFSKRPVPAVMPDAVSSNAKDVGRVEVGVIAEYGLTKNPIIKRLEGRISHYFYSSMPGPEIATSGTFWGRWLGGLRVPVTGGYALRLEAEASAEVHINGVSVLKVPVPGPRAKVAKEARVSEDGRVHSVDSPPLTLNKGQIYLLEVSFTSRRGDPSFMRLAWKPPGKTEFEDIPPDILVMPVTAKDIPRKLPK